MDASDARARRLERRIVLEAERPGGIPFDRFVELALYDPDDGYYRREDRTVGPSGDFYTAVHVHPLFARTIARHVAGIYRDLGRPADFRLVEVGAGDGTLARELRAALVASGEPGAIRRHTVVELPGPRRDALEAALASRADGGGPPTFVGALAELGPFRGVVVANELLDAFPFRRFVRRGDGWRELRVVAMHGRLAAEEAAPDRPIPPPTPGAAEEGTILELAPGAEDWVRELADHLVEGRALLFDYGREEPELLAAFRGGTVAAVRRHRDLPDPLERPGEVDLSIFVNFTRLRDAAQRAGLREVAYRSQAEALASWGFEELRDAALRAAPDDESRVRTQLAAKQLLFGFSGFQLLELAPGRPAT